MTTEPAGRILALDLGARRIGLAVSDALGWTAQGLPSLERRNMHADLDALRALIREQGVRLVVLGNPLHLSGGESAGSRHAAHFAAQLRRHTGVPVELWDERLTSREASRVLRSSGVSIAKRAQAVDRLSAVLLLSGYLEYHNLRRSEAAAPQP